MHSVAGQIEWNTRKIISALETARAERVDIVVTPELALVGYPPDDLLTFQWILAAQKKALEQLALATKSTGVGLLVGHVEPTENNWFWNTASLFDEGELVGCVRKERLPSYNIFAETRHFVSYGKPQPLITFRGVKMGVSICEDAWDEVEAYGSLFVRKYSDDSPIFKDERKNCDLHINISASPFEWNKDEQRTHAFSEIARRLGKPFIWVNRVGSQDEVLFDGQSAIYDGSQVVRAKSCAEDFLVWQSDARATVPQSQPASPWQTLSEILTLGLKNFVLQSKAKSVVIGLSGGVDSACVAALACRALGPQNVLGVSQPSEFTSQESRDLARELADNLKIEFREYPITEVVSTAAKTLDLKHTGVPYENLQSRARALVLMAESNRSGRLLLACSNKSEFAMGYGTLYGDIAGAMSPVGDLLKTQVYGLCHYWNREREIIPPAILRRVPTAELAIGQKDTDSLPPYEVLDAFLYELLDRQGIGFVDRDWKSFLKTFTAQELIKKVLGAEFKRYQSPPILKISNRAFGLSWRVPIAIATELI